jgi:hypothetical protein
MTRYYFYKVDFYVREGSVWDGGWSQVVAISDDKMTPTQVFAQIVKTCDDHKRQLLESIAKQLEEPVDLETMYFLIDQFNRVE